MRPENTILRCCLIVFVLFAGGCKSGPDNTAISSDGVKISFESQGKGEPALLFVHGWANNKSLWDDQMKYFSKKYQSVAVDLAGFGASGNNRTDWTMEAFGKDIIAVINKLELKQVVLVGFSMGGPVVIEAANKIPGQVPGIVLVDNLQNVDMKMPPQMMERIDSVMMDLVNHPTMEKLVAGGFAKKDPEKAYKKALEMLKNTSRIGWKESGDNIFRWQNERSIEALSDLQVPVISINSDRIPTNVEAFKKYVPSFEVKIMPGVGHVVMLEDPETFNVLLEESIQEFINKSK